MKKNNKISILKKMILAEKYLKILNSKKDDEDKIRYFTLVFKKLDQRSFLDTANILLPKISQIKLAQEYDYFWEIIKGKMSQKQVAELVIELEDIRKSNNQLFILSENGRYFYADEITIKSQILKFTSSSNSFVNEVYKVMNLLLRNVDDKINDYIIAFNNIILSFDNKKVEVIKNIPFIKHKIPHNLKQFLKIEKNVIEKEAFIQDDLSVIFKNVLKKEKFIEEKNLIVENFLNQISNNNFNIRKELLQMMAVSLIPSNMFQTGFVLLGKTAANGKSTLLNFFQNTIGTKNYSNLNLKDLNNPFRASLVLNKLVNIGSEISNNYLKDTEFIKGVLTGDSQIFEKKYDQPKGASSYAKFIFSANEIPISADKSNAWIRRWKIIPMEANFNKNPDLKMKDKLNKKENYEYLLWLLVQELIEVLKNEKLFTSPETEKSIVEYKYENNNLDMFLNENEESDFLGKQLRSCYDQYKDWCWEEGHTEFSLKKFSQSVKIKFDLISKQKNIINAYGKRVKLSFFEKNSIIS